MWLNKELAKCCLHEPCRCECMITMWFCSFSIRVPSIQDVTYGRLIHGKGSCLDSVNGFYNSVVKLVSCRSTFSGPGDSQVSSNSILLFFISCHKYDVVVVIVVVFLCLFCGGDMLVLASESLVLLRMFYWQCPCVAARTFFFVVHYCLQAWLIMIVWSVSIVFPVMFIGKFGLCSYCHCDF